MSHPRSSPHPRRWLLVVLLTAVVLGLAAPAVLAHPWGPPPTALITADGDRVTVEWAAAPDDAMIVGMTVGVVDDDGLDRYLEAPVQVAPGEDVEQALAESDLVRAYLRERISVVQDGRACEATVRPIDDFLNEGARIDFDCPEPVEEVDLGLRVLHDVHDAYRTFAITEGDGAPAQSVFTVENPEQRWDFTVPRDEAEPASNPAPTPQPGRSWPLIGAAAVVVAALGGMAALAWWRRNRREAT